jgi:hypothetical protein
LSWRIPTLDKNKIKICEISNARIDAIKTDRTFVFVILKQSTNKTNSIKKLPPPKINVLKTTAIKIIRIISNISLLMIDLCNIIRAHNNTQVYFMTFNNVETLPLFIEDSKNTLIIV